MKKIKVLTVLGTRPEIIRLSEVIKELDLCTDHILVHTGQNYDYGLSEVFFNDLGLRKPDYFLDASSKTPSKTVGKIIYSIDDILDKEKPEAVLVLGDTNSCMSAYAAKRRKVPIFHMEAGNRCFDGRVPEETNRRIIDQVSDINLVYSDLARQNLIKEGIPLDRIIKTGSPLTEVIKVNSQKIDISNVLDDLSLENGDYFVLSAHREENIDIDDNFNRLVSIIKAVAETYNKKIIFSAHPRTANKFEIKKIKLPDEVLIIKPLGLFDYLKLQMNALCVISDSGTISEESSILNFTAINLRESHERPEAMDEGSVIMSGLSVERVLQAIEIAIKQSRVDREFEIPKDYSSTNVSKKVVRVIVSYTDYIKRVVWSKTS